MLLSSNHDVGQSYSGYCFCHIIILVNFFLAISQFFGESCLKNLFLVSTYFIVAHTTCMKSFIRFSQTVGQIKLRHQFRNSSTEFIVHRPKKSKGNLAFIVIFSCQGSKTFRGLGQGEKFQAHSRK